MSRNRDDERDSRIINKSQLPSSNRDDQPQSPTTTIMLVVGGLLLLLVVAVGIKVYRSPKNPIERQLEEAKNQPVDLPKLEDTRLPIQTVEEALVALQDDRLYQEGLRFLANSPPQPVGENPVSKALSAFDPDRYACREQFMAAIAIWGGPSNLPMIEKFNTEFAVTSDRNFGKLVARCFLRLNQKVLAAKIIVLHLVREHHQSGAESLVGECKEEVIKGLEGYINDPNPKQRERAEAYLREKIVWKDPKDLDRLLFRQSLRDLKTDDAGQFKSANKRLKELHPSMKQEKIPVIAPLIEVIKDRHLGFADTEVLDTLKTWRIKEDDLVILQAIENDPLTHELMQKVFALAIDDRDPKMAPYLVKRLDHSDPNVSKLAFNALKSLGAQVKDELSKGVQANSERIRQSSAQLLALISQKPKDPPTIVRHKSLLIQLKAAKDDVEKTRFIRDLMVTDPMKDQVTAESRKDVVDTVIAATNPRNRNSLASGISTLRIWATKDHLEAVVKFAQENGNQNISDLISLLGSWKDSAVVPAIVSSLDHKENQMMALVAIREIGATSEPELLKHLLPKTTSDDKLLQLVRMLDEIGTPKAVPRLEVIRKYALQKKNTDLVKATESAIQQTRRRVKK